MAWQLPLYFGDTWQSRDYYNQCVQVCNDARPFYNAMITDITGNASDTIAALASLDTNANLQADTTWAALQNRVELMLENAMHYDNIADSTDVEDIFYRDKSNGWGTLITEANSILTADTVDSGDLFDTSTLSDGGKIPWKRSYHTFSYWPRGGTTADHGVVQGGDVVGNTTVINQIYACCKLIQDLTLGGFYKYLSATSDNLRTSWVAENIALDSESGHGDYIGFDTDCGTAKDTAVSYYDSGSWDTASAEPDYPPFASVSRDGRVFNGARWTWSINRQKAKANITDLENGDLKTFAFQDAIKGYLDTDFYDIDGQGYAHGQIHEVVTNASHTDSTELTGYYGAFDTNPITANSGDISCGDTAEVETNWNYQMWPGYALKTSISDPT